MIQSLIHILYSLFPTPPNMNGQDLAIPQLPSRSIEKTLAFYARLGFEGEAVPGHDYAIVDRGSMEIHFFLHEALRPEESAFSCYLRVQDVDSLYKALSAANLPRIGIPRIEPLENKPWGMREFAVIDEDGTLIRIGQEL
jgi:catechol 2,3-dioxygenase-like lactoylglutathione lyase family enzyme